MQDYDDQQSDMGKFQKTKGLPVNNPYILCVNSIRVHKNLITLLKAFQLIQDQVEHYLVLTGIKGDNHLDPEQYASKKLQAYLGHTKKYRKASLL